MKTSGADSARLRGVILAERASSADHLSTELRAEAASYARRRSAEGALLREIAQELGVSTASVSRWLRTVERSAEVAALVPVHVVTCKAESAARLEVVTPRGLRVVGLDLDALSALLERLG